MAFEKHVHLNLQVISVNNTNIKEILVGGGVILIPR